MSRNKKIGTGLVVLILVIIGGYLVFAGNDSDSTSDTMSTQNASQSPASSDEGNTASKEEGVGQPKNTAKGRYVTYSAENNASTGYSKNIIFFYAPWCPECRAFKEAIQGVTIPDGTQVLEADFDSSTDLKKKYGVTLQSSFVRVDSSGQLQSKWVGYGKDKSLNTVLENLE